MQGMRTRARVCGVAGAAALSVLAMAGPARAQGALPSCTSTHWVGSWAASPTSAGSGADLYASAPYASVAEQSYRMVVTPHLGGSTLRVRLSNRFGLAPTQFGRVTVAQRGAGSAIDPATLRPVTFGSSRSPTARSRPTPPRCSACSQSIARRGRGGADTARERRGHADHWVRWPSRSGVH